MQLLSYVLTGISVILIIVMLVTYKKTRRMTSKTLWISIAITLVILIAYALFVGSSLPFWALVLIGAVGAFFGLLRGQSTRLWTENGRVLAQNTRWFLVIWALCYLLNLALLNLAKSYSLNIGIGAMCLGTGVTIGSQGIILIKLPKAKAKTSRTCSRCGNEIPVEQKFCNRCGQAMPAAVPASSINQTMRKCPVCGFSDNAMNTFCTRCGRKLV